MQPPLSLRTLLPLLESTVSRLSAVQITVPGHPAFGALIGADDGRPAPSPTAGFLTYGVYLCLLRRAPDGPLLDRLLAAADALLALQRPSGLIDLPSVNIDSGPDTGFIVQHLCTLLDLGGARRGRMTHAGSVCSTAWNASCAALFPGWPRAAFTPNHRWVIAAALVQAQALFPDLDVAGAIDAYLDEGIDADAEGFYIERSVGVCDSVNNRSWLLIAEHRPVDGALDGVCRNLEVDLHLLHADGTAETGLSHRQDYGVRDVPTGLIPCYLLYHHLRPAPELAAAAQALWALASTPGDLLWTCYALLRGGDPAPAAADALPGDFALSLPINGIWRLRRGPLSVSVFRDTARLFAFGWGHAMISAGRIDQTYFGGDCGRFIGNTMTVADEEVALQSDGLGRPRRPGYEMPLGHPVPPERWAESIAERDLRMLPPAASSLTFSEIVGGLALHYRTLDGMHSVAAQIALDFEPGGIWETADTRLVPQPGQVLFLKQGWGEMRYGTDVIRIEGGAYATSMAAMRESVEPGRSVRVLLTFETPVDHTFRLVGFSGPDAVYRAGS